MAEPYIPSQGEFRQTLESISVVSRPQRSDQPARRMAHQRQPIMISRDQVGSRIKLNSIVEVAMKPRSCRAGAGP
jgi:hypothetical protein